MFEANKFRNNLSPPARQKSNKEFYQGPLKPSKSMQQFENFKSPIAKYKSEYEEEIEHREYIRENINDSRIQRAMKQFMSPKEMAEAMLRAPLKLGVNVCSEEEFKREAKKAGNKCQEMEQEIKEVEKMLHMRSRLHERLEKLHEERERMELDVEARFNDPLTNTTQERSEELRFWIHKVRDFIRKLNIENTKLEEALRQRSIKQEHIKIWQTAAKHIDEWGKLETVSMRLQRKQEEAWKKVEAQQFGIFQRNNNHHKIKVHTRSYV